jgi:hypothetical protein
MLAILGFAVIVWMTETIDYAASAIVIATPIGGRRLSPDMRLRSATGVIKT